VVERIFLGLADARQRGDGDERQLPLLNVRDLHDGHVPPADTLTSRMVPSGADVERYTVRADDVLITCRGTQLKVASITGPSEGALISANLIAVRAGTKLLPAVLLAFLQSPAAQKALLQRGRSSTSSLSLTPKTVGELSIPVPPLTVQKQIAELISSAEQNYVAAVRAADQRRAIAHAVAVDLLRGKTGV
jgi:type I restriction modification DNA specificity protein